MEKTSKNKLADVTRLLTLQKIRDVKDLESYKLSVCHPYSAGIDLGSREIYVALAPRVAAEIGLPIMYSILSHPGCRLVANYLWIVVSIQ